MTSNIFKILNKQKATSRKCKDNFSDMEFIDDLMNLKTAALSKVVKVSYRFPIQQSLSGKEIVGGKFKAR